MCIYVKKVYDSFSYDIHNSKMCCLFLVSIVCFLCLSYAHRATVTTCLVLTRLYFWSTTLCLEWCLFVYRRLVLYIDLYLCSLFMLLINLCRPRLDRIVLPIILLFPVEYDVLRSLFFVRISVPCVCWPFHGYSNYHDCYVFFGLFMVIP
ncbi:hypothetical protein VPH35_017431 [Triticum aestivum]